MGRTAGDFLFPGKLNIYCSWSPGANVQCVVLCKAGWELSCVCVAQSVGIPFLCQAFNSEKCLMTQAPPGLDI